jgi:hypothetical protein
MLMTNKSLGSPECLIEPTAAATYLGVISTGIEELIITAERSVRDLIVRDIGDEAVDFTVAAAQVRRLNTLHNAADGARLAAEDIHAANDVYRAHTMAANLIHTAVLFDEPPEGEQLRLPDIAHPRLGTATMAYLVLDHMTTNPSEVRAVVRLAYSPRP